MKLKKVVALSLASMFALTSMTACASKVAETKPAEIAMEETTVAESSVDETVEKAMEGKDLSEVKVGISIYKFDDNFMTLYRQELERYLIEKGVKKENIIVQDGKNDQAEQTNQINNFITSGVDVMILNLVQSSSAPTVTKLAQEAGIPVVYINREPDEAEIARWDADKVKATYVGADARQSGKFQGGIIADLPNKGDVNGDGTVSYIMIQGDPENVDAQFRTEFSVKELEASGVKVEQLLMQRGDWDQAKGQQITQDALTQFGEKVEVVFSNNDSMALGALEAIKAANRKVGEDIYIVGVDALAEVCQNVAEDKMTGTVFNDFISQARTAGDVALDFVAGKEIDTKIGVDYVKVTKENANDILELVK